MKTAVLNRIVGWATAAAVVLLPLVFLPETVMRLMPAKMAWLFITVFVAMAAYLAEAWSEKRLRLPRNLLLTSLWILVIVAFISALFAPLPMNALLGQGFESDIVLVLVLGASLAFLLAAAVRQGERTWYTYVGLAVVFVLTVLYHLIRFAAGADTLTFGQFVQQTQNFIGSWNDFGIFAGVITLLSLITTALLPLRGFARIAAYVVLGLGLVFMMLVNFVILWYAVGVIALLMLIVAAKKKLPRARIIVPAIVLAVAIIGVTLGTQIVGFLNPYLQTSVVEVRPSLQMTYDVGTAVVNSGNYLGSGPNHFFYDWLKFKPTQANLDQVFWNTDFTAGYSYVATMYVTLGFLGLAAWLLIIVSLIWTAIRVARHTPQSLMSGYFLYTSLVATLFLTFTLLLYIPSLTIIALWFAFVGMLVASLTREGLVRERVLAFGADTSRRWLGFIGIGIAAVITLAVFVGGATRLVAVMLAQGAIAAANEQTGDPIANLQTAEDRLNRAARIAPHSVYHRSLVSIDLAQLSLLINQANATSTNIDALRTAFQEEVTETNAHLERAVVHNPYDYQNYIAAGNFYASLAGLGAPDQLQSAQLAFAKAREFNPHNPLIPLIQARIAASQNDLGAARTYVEEAIKIKPNYIDAYFLLAQIQVANDDIPGAVASVQNTIQINPQNPLLYFQLGLLHYNNRSYQNARTAFEQAVALTPVYANAKYFLGLTLANLGRTQEAIKQFEDVLGTNPDSVEVQTILANLRAGRAPFDGATPQIAQPEDRPTLPIEEPEE
jgi:tetratricopeptide (TPR) repeat protein